MADKTKKASLKGAVLYTVTAVMFIMIIIVLGTISLAGAARNRAYSNYFENQTTYTAQSMVDSVITSLQPSGANEAVGNQILANLGTKGTPVDVDVDITGMDGYGKITKLEFTYVADYGDGVGEYYIPNVTKGSGSNKIIKVTATVEMGGQTSTYSRYVIGQGQKSTLDSNGGGYNAIASNPGGNGTDTNQKIYGHNYAGIEGETNKDAEWGNKYVAAGDILYNLGSGHTLNIKESSDIPMLYFGRNDPADNFYSGLYVNGNIAISGTKEIVSYYDKEESSYMIFDGTEINDILQYDNISNIPYIKAEGTISMTSGTLKVTGGPVNIFADRILLGTGGGVSLSGPMNIFCTGTGTSELASDSSNLTRWAASVVSGTDINDLQTGNFFTNGSVNFKGNGPYTINGDLVVKGTLNVTAGNGISVSGKVFCDDITDATKVTAAGGIKSINDMKTELTSSGAKKFTGTDLDHTAFADYSMEEYFNDVFAEEKKMLASNGKFVDSKVFQNVQNLQKLYYEESEDPITHAPVKVYRAGHSDLGSIIGSSAWDGSSLNISSSCTFTQAQLNSLSGKTVNIKSSSSAAVVLTFDASCSATDNINFVVDDAAGKVVFYIKNPSGMDFKQTLIVSKTYYDLIDTAQGTIDLPDLTSYPDKKYVGNLFIYADPKNTGTIKFSSGKTFFSGDIFAPGATFTVAAAGLYPKSDFYYTFYNYADVNKDLSYNADDKYLDKVSVKIPGGNSGNHRLGVLGSIEVHKMIGVTNDFAYLYVDDPPKEDTGGKAPTGYAWQIIDGYANY